MSTTTPDPYAPRTCAHGRLSCVECSLVPLSRAGRAMAEAGGWSEFMRAHALVRFEYEGPEGRYVMERHPSAFAPPVADAEPQRDADRCACGHSLSVEHADGGCMHGCDVDTCNKTEVAGG